LYKIQLNQFELQDTTDCNLYIQLGKNNDLIWGCSHLLWEDEQFLHFD